ncbi:MAG: ATP-binding protein [Magnetococcales bacterium]|nr:ATP-binding protein [Magnetococcales bacterium]
MRVSLRDMGTLKTADFEVGELTVICGKNNTGKTYAVYALYGFLELWREFVKIDFGARHIDVLKSTGSTILDLVEITEKLYQALDKGCAAYSSVLHKIFAARIQLFSSARFSLTLDSERILLDQPFERTIRSRETNLIYFRKLPQEKTLQISWMQEGKQREIPVSVIERMVHDALFDLLLVPALPPVFMASAERTGATIFARELDFARNRLLEQMGDFGKDLDVIKLMSRAYGSYALPVTKNVDFTRNYNEIVKNDSFLMNKYPDILKDFNDLIGGEYRVIQNQMHFQSREGRVQLTMNESSSAVRSLLTIGLYLRHMAEPGAMLMVDEPEINLHPENQRRLARLFARLINAGIKVFVTTHSDYLIKEWNTLIMLNYLPEASRAPIMKKYGYREDELLSVERLRVYNAGLELRLLNGNVRKTRVYTLEPADIDSRLGIEVKDFDDTISKMTTIQDEILEEGEVL